MHTLFGSVRGRPTQHRVFLEWAGPRTQRKTMTIIKTFKDHGPYRRNDKSECQECTCKIDKSLNRRMCIKFESRKICVAGNQCDNSDFDFHTAEHKELPVIKISSDEGIEDCQQLKPKGTQNKCHTWPFDECTTWPL